jgi:hypothetical protein
MPDATCLWLTCRLAITPSGSLAITDATNTTHWSSQTSCLPAVAPSSGAAGGVVRSVVGTRSASNLKLCLDDSGKVTLEDGSGAATVWSSSQTLPCQGRLRQLISYSRGALQCIEAFQSALVSHDNCSLQLAVGGGLLQLSASALGSPIIWRSQVQGLPSTRPAGLCLLANGSLLHSSAAGSWSSPGAGAGSSLRRPFIALIRDSALQVSCWHMNLWGPFMAGWVLLMPAAAGADTAP